MGRRSSTRSPACAVALTDLAADLMSVDGRGAGAHGAAATIVGGIAAVSRPDAAPRRSGLPRRLAVAGARVAAAVVGRVAGSAGSDAALAEVAAFTLTAAAVDAGLTVTSARAAAPPGASLAAATILVSLAAAAHPAGPGSGPPRAECTEGDPDEETEASPPRGFDAEEPRDPVEALSVHPVALLTPHRH